jgi:hypothetical protein
MPFFNPANWEISKLIIKNGQSLMDEYHSAVKHNLVQQKPNDTTSFERDLYDGYVNFFPLHMETDLWSAKERTLYTEKSQEIFDRNKNLSPIARSIIAEFPAVRQWYWNGLQPGGKVTPHYGTNGRLYNKTPDHYRIQFCWEPGNNCRFYLEDSYIEYSENLCFGFDDGMDLHWVENNGDKWRTVLILDLWRDLCPPANWDLGHDKTVYYQSSSVS